MDGESSSKLCFGGRRRHGPRITGHAQSIVWRGTSMQRLLRASLFLMLGLSIARDGIGQQEVASPVERYQALLKDYQDASSGRVRSDE